MRGHEVIPSARRLIRSLRDLGYDFAAAVADLIDNSIAANATEVRVDIRFEGDDSWVRIVDNGNGMTSAALREAMRYGAERDYAENDLGKFGLGLKTASMSQCQRLSVASRVNRERADIAAFCWDLDHIERTNRWEILALDRGSAGSAMRDPLKTGIGTVVLWQRLDRILGFKHPYGEQARKRLLTMCRELEVHLGMVFHRFLAGEVKSRHLKILVNTNAVEPWDPYARGEPTTQRLHPVTLKVERDGEVQGSVLVEPFVLPQQHQFSSPNAHALASGPLKWNRQQGFYIYRADRMIQSGGWSNLRTLDEHLKLARVAVSFPTKLDEAFKINVAKMRVQLPQGTREAMEKAIAPVLRIADRTYRKTPSAPIGDNHHGSETQHSGGTTNTSKATNPRQQPTAQSTTVPASGGSATAYLSPRTWTIEDLAARLEATATKTEKPVVRAVISRFRQQLEHQA